MVAPTPTATAAPAPATGTPGFAAPPVFNTSGQALAVFNGRTLAELNAAAKAGRASGVWLQTPAGAYVVYIIGGPSFLEDEIRRTFASGFGGGVAVTLVQ